MRIPDSTLRARIFTHPGDVYNVNALDRDFMALWNTGYFDDIKLEVSDGKTGKIVTFFVEEKPLIRSMTFKHMNTITESDVLQAFQKEKVNLSIMSQYDPVEVKHAEVVIREMESAHGRQFATVIHRTRNIPPDMVALTFIVNEGPKVKVGDIRFQGNKVFRNATLVHQMKLTRPVGVPPWFYWFHKTYDRDKILYDLGKVRSFYQDHGYFYALPEEPKVKMVTTTHRWPFFFWSWGQGKKVNVTIPIEEGHQYHLGKFNIEGNKLFKGKQLDPVLQMKPGEVFDLSKVRRAIKNYTTLYGEFGYINFVATPDPEPNRKTHVVNLTLDFDEGHQFFIHRINFRGNTKTRDKVVRRQLLVYEGNVFNTELWKFSILRVNQLGFFNRIKKTDYEVRQNPANHTVDLTLNLHERGRNSIGFSGGVSGLAGNFVGFNYATNNFLGLGETLSLEMQFGTYEKLYQFGFTKPYIFNRPITTGFTLFENDYHFDQFRQTAFLAGLNPNSSTVQQALGQYPFQNFTQNSSGFTSFLNYPLPRKFARIGLSYTFSKSSLQTFSAASQLYFQALDFSGIAGPNALSGITMSQISPSYVYNTVDNPFEPHHGKYLYIGANFSGSVLGGEVNTIAPTIEAKYFHPINHGRNVLAFHFLGSTVSGYGGRVVPPFSRFYIGGEYDIRGFYIGTISPIAFFPTITSVCNRDNAGNPIWATNSSGQPLPGTCGSSTQFPAYTLIFPGGDTELVGNFEYRIPIAGPVTLAYFVDLGANGVWQRSQLDIQPSALTQITDRFPYFDVSKQIQVIGLTNFRPHMSTGLELQVIIPTMNIPFRVYYAYNPLRLDNTVSPPLQLPPESLFPNHATYESVMPLFAPIPLREQATRIGFTVARTF